MNIMKQALTKKPENIDDKKLEDELNRLYRSEYPRNLRDLIISTSLELYNNNKLKKPTNKIENKFGINSRNKGLVVNSILKDHLESKDFYSNEEVKLALICDDGAYLGHSLLKERYQL